MEAFRDRERKAEAFVMMLMSLLVSLYRTAASVGPTPVQDTSQVIAPARFKTVTAT